MGYSLYHVYLLAALQIPRCLANSEIDQHNMEKLRSSSRQSSQKDGIGGLTSARSACTDSCRQRRSILAASGVSTTEHVHIYS